MGMNGIDISNYQSTLDLAKVPCDFVIVKATQGTSYVNPSCDKHVQQALKLDKPFGVYHYISGVGTIADGYIGRTTKPTVERHVILPYVQSPKKHGISSVYNSPC